MQRFCSGNFTSRTGLHHTFIHSLDVGVTGARARIGVRATQMRSTAGVITHAGDRDARG
jgi:hypothetical protein